MFFIIVFFFSVYYCYSWTTWLFLFIACDFIYIVKVLQNTYSWLLMSFIFFHTICSCVLVSQRAVCFTRCLFDYIEWISDDAHQDRIQGLSSKTHYKRYRLLQMNF